jgi:hypothetical protein
MRLVLRPVRTVPEPHTQSLMESITQRTRTLAKLSTGDRNAPYPPPAVLKALGFSNVQEYRDAHLAREYPQRGTTATSDETDGSEDTQHQIDLTNKIQKLASERSHGWN